jgi:hypothetical protein
MERCLGFGWFILLLIMLTVVSGIIGGIVPYQLGAPLMGIIALAQFFLWLWWISSVGASIFTTCEKKADGPYWRAKRDSILNRSST